MVQIDVYVRKKIVSLQCILVYSLMNERCTTLRIMEMKTMKHITKTDHKPLSLNNLGGGIALP